MKKLALVLMLISMIAMSANARPLFEDPMQIKVAPPMDPIEDIVIGGYTVLPVMASRYSFTFSVLDESEVLPDWVKLEPEVDKEK